MEIQEIIDGITTSECVNCKFGKALIALKPLLVDSAPEEKAAAPAAPKSKLQGKTAVLKPKKIVSASIQGSSKRCRVCEKTKFIDDFPKNKICVDGHTNECKACCSERHRRRYSKNGTGKQTTSAPEQKKSSASIPSSAAPGIIRCKLCDYRALDEARLASHMRTNHGEVRA
jgi:hypothetical protein